jgi:hypothetical protein
MPPPSNAVPLGGGCDPVTGGLVGVERGSLRILIGRVVLDRIPRGARTYSRPERAVLGTLTTSRELLALRGFMLRIVRLPSARRTGNITRLADRGRRRPASFTMPPGATVLLSVQPR